MSNKKGGISGVKLNLLEMGRCPKPRFILFYAKKNETKRKQDLLTFERNKADQCNNHIPLFQKSCKGAYKRRPHNGTEFLTALQSASGEFVQTRFAQTRTNLMTPLQLPSSPKLANRGG